MKTETPIIAELISQRADHLHEQLSAHTTRLRPLLNTRDEPLADALRFRRLHVLAVRRGGGLSVEETAAVLKISGQSVMRDWRLAKSWLMREIRG